MYNRIVYEFLHIPPCLTDCVNLEQGLVHFIEVLLPASSSIRFKDNSGSVRTVLFSRAKKWTVWRRSKILRMQALGKAGKGKNYIIPLVVVEGCTIQHANQRVSTGKVNLWPLVVGRIYSLVTVLLSLSTNQ